MFFGFNKSIRKLKLINFAEPKVKTESSADLTDASSPKKSKILIQSTQRKTNVDTEPQKANVVNGQQPNQTSKDQSNDFVLTPDYIQQS